MITSDELRGAEPLAEELWFQKYQYWLLRLANTNEGRDILLLPPWRTHPYPVVELRRDMVKFYLGRWDALEHYQSEFKSRAPQGDIIRSRWQEVREAINQTVLRSILDYPPVYTRDGRLLHPVGGATHTFFYPQASAGTAIDGVAYASVGGAGATFSTIRGMNGTGAASSWPVDDMGRSYTSTTSPNWQAIHRQFLLFDTSSLGSNDTIDSGSVTLTTDSTMTDSFGDDTVLTDSDPASPTSISGSDYQRMVTTTAQSDTRIDVGDYGVDEATVVFPLNAAGLVTVTAARDGITKFGGRLSSDQDNTSPTWVSGGQSTPRYYSANNNTGISFSPKLTILHTAPFTPKSIMF